MKGKDGVGATMDSMELERQSAYPRRAMRGKEEGRHVPIAS